MNAREFATTFPQASGELERTFRNQDAADPFILAVIFWHNVNIQERIDAVSDALSFDIRNQ